MMIQKGFKMYQMLLVLCYDYYGGKYEFQGRKFIPIYRKGTVNKLKRNWLYSYIIK